MILKYFSQGEWHYIDNISELSTQYNNSDDLIKQFDEDVSEGRRVALEDTDERATQMRSKVFHAGAHRAIKGIEPYEVILEDAVTLSKPQNPETVCTTTAIRNKAKHVIVTTEVAYLLNDKGQTIEKLI
jgi:hypothetical protein